MGGVWEGGGGGGCHESRIHIWCCTLLFPLEAELLIDFLPYQLTCRQTLSDRFDQQVRTLRRDTSFGLTFPTLTTQNHLLFVIHEQMVYVA